ncbi:MAG: LamG domain-containing protein, partial [Planctomycetota bacterium]
MKAKMIVVAVLVVVGLCFPAWALDGIVSHWKFDEGTGSIAYDSAGTNDGTIYGATWTTGKIDGALSFDGVDDYVHVGNDSSLMTTGDLTIIAWIKARGTRACIYSHSWNGWGLGFGIGNNNYDGRLGFYTKTHGHWIKAGSSLADDTWHHVAVTLSGTMVTLYTDGIEIGSETGTPAANLTGIGLIGLYNYAWHFGGLLDEIAIFNRALSDQEILEIYYTGMGDTDWTLGVPVMEVNTEYAEWDPFLSADGLSLYYSKGKTNTFYFHRLYQATRQEPFEPFTSINEISELNYSGGHIQDPWVSPDNLRLYYMRTEPGNYWRLKFSERASVNDPWPVGVNISELNVLNQTLRSPTLTADELTIFFSSFPTNPIPGGEGGDDIWMATRPDRYSPFGNITNQ